MSQVRLVWATPEGEALVAYMARVPNPKNQHHLETAPKLLRYLARHKHWSPFEMVNVCMEIEATRDIARQILRPRSFSFQEFRQRYAKAEGYEPLELRLQDHTNRQNSVETDDADLKQWWHAQQEAVTDLARRIYDQALEQGIAKEVARKILPEGMVLSRMYMNGSLRSWTHYVRVRTDTSTQKEHRDVAHQCQRILEGLFPNIFTTEGVAQTNSMRRQSMVKRKETFGERVRRKRMEKQITLREFSKIIGVSSTYISLIELNRVKPPVEQKIRKIAKVLDDNEDEMLVLAQKIPSDLIGIIQKNIKEIAILLRAAKELKREDWENLIKNMPGTHDRSES